MPSVLEPAPNVRVCEKTEIVTTELQFGIWLRLRKMRVKEPGPTDQGKLGALLEVVIIFFFQNLLGPRPCDIHSKGQGMKNLATLHPPCVASRVKLRQSKAFFAFAIWVNASATAASVSSLRFVSGSASVLGHSILMRCIGTLLIASTWGRRNKQSIATYLHLLPFFLCYCWT